MEKLTNNAGKRDTTIDQLKGVAIMLMIFGHSGLSFQLPATKVLIYSFHMPLFFFVSGYYMHYKPLLTFISTDLRRLMIPWLIAGVAFLIWSSLWGSGEVWTIRLKDAFTLYLYGYMPLWFLPAMLIGRLLVQLVIHWRWMALLFLPILFIPQLSGIMRMLSWSAGLCAALFVGAGYLYRSCLKGTECGRFLIYAGLTLSMLTTTRYLEMCNNVYPFGKIISLLGSAGITFMLYSALKRLGGRTYSTFFSVGRLTFFVYPLRACCSIIYSDMARK